MELQYLERRVHVNSVLGDTDLLALEMTGRCQEVPMISVLFSVTASSFKNAHMQARSLSEKHNQAKELYVRS